MDIDDLGDWLIILFYFVFYAGCALIFVALIVWACHYLFGGA